MRRLFITAILMLAAGMVFAGGNQEKGQAATQTAQTNAVTTASIVNTKDAFLKAIGPDGSWIIATLTDLSFDQDLTLAGQFTHNNEPERKIALYGQDENRKVTARYTLKAPKLTVTSENARIQGGTFVGDVYVQANGFLVVDATVQGNVYFANQQYQSSFQMTDGGKVTGKTEVKQQ